MYYKNFYWVTQKEKLNFGINLKIQLNKKTMLKQVFILFALLAIANADMFLAVFNSVSDAEYCYANNKAYMDKLSTNVEQHGSTILLDLISSCDPIISDEFEQSTGCGNVKQSQCIYN